MINTPLDQFAIISLVPIRLGNLDFSFTNSSFYLLCSTGLVFLLFHLVTLNGGNVVPSPWQVLKKNFSHFLIKILNMVLIVPRFIRAFYLCLFLNFEVLKKTNPKIATMLVVAGISIITLYATTIISSCCDVNNDIRALYPHPYARNGGLSSMPVHDSIPTVPHGRVYSALNYNNHFVEINDRYGLGDKYDVIHHVYHILDPCVIHTAPLEGQTSEIVENVRLIVHSTYRPTGERFSTVFRTQDIVSTLSDPDLAQDDGLWHLLNRRPIKSLIRDID